MLNIGKYASNSANFNFSFTTSSGDKIDLKMFDSIEAENHFTKTRTSVSQELTLTHQFGYEFHYEGNGLDENDIKEIKEAFKKIKPMLKEFLKQKDINEKVIKNAANRLKSYLPPIKNQNHLNALKQEGVNTFDEVLKSIKAGIEELKKAKELFDNLFNQKFEIYV